MKTVKNHYENITISTPLLKYCECDDILFFDIETTGLSKERNSIYLIGCGYYKDGGLSIIQWFSENEAEEVLVLKAFLDFSSSFSTLVNYNGKTFDIPFTTSRLNKYNMEMPSFNSVDIYTMVKPLKKFLSLNDITQKSVESFLKINRNDKYNGGELISVYKKYCNSSIPAMPYFMSAYDNFKSNEDRFNALILHNLEDVLNMHYLSEITEYTEILKIKPEYIRHEINEYSDFNSNTKKEMVIHGKYSQSLKIHSFRSFYNNQEGSFIMNFTENGTVIIIVPIIECTLKCFMSNFKDYYYLPKEDICIYKSMGGGVAKENRENAKKETCYVKCNDSFIPVCMKKTKNNDNTEFSAIHVFKSEYKSKYEYIRLEDFNNLNNELKSEYIDMLVHSFA